MTKILLVTLNLIFLLAYKIFFGGDLTIDQKFPDEVQSGEAFMVEVTIEKGDREGFAKWQQSLPEGFIAEAKETEGATFSFKNQEVKIIWMAIPKQETFTISYEVTTDEEIRGDFELEGQFSFIEENQRKDVSSSPKKISIISEEEPVLAEEVQEEKPAEPDTVVGEMKDQIAEQIETKEDSISEETTEKIEDEEVSKNMSEKGQRVASRVNISIYREINSLQNGLYEVTLTIHKESLESFGKIEEYLPPNYIASSIDNGEGMYSFNRNVVKILWMSLPSEESIQVKYQMESTTDELDSSKVHGVFSYLVGDDPKQLELKASSFANTFVPEIAEAEEKSEEETLAEEEIVQQEASEEEITEEIEEEFEEAKSDEDLAEEVSNVPSPETAVSYKVQIAAGKKEVKQQYFIDRHSIVEPVSIEFHETWYKYTIGKFPVYKEARDKRNQVWANDNKINDAFVTAYNAGERISVQEALMISQQKWYK